jgi:hypothetical protein
VVASAATVLGQTSDLPNLTSRLVVVRFSMAGGRIEATADQPGFEREQTSTIEPGRHETLSVSTNNEEEASVKYDLATDTEQLSVNVSDGCDVSISRHPAKKPHAAQVDFQQPRTGPIVLTVEQDGVKREIRGDTVWYLLLSEPELCREHLLPLLAMLRSDWRLVETAQAIESQMLRIAGAYREANLRRWSRLVGNLASDQFMVREAADRQLRAEGTVVLPFLQSLDRHQLDFEQASRIDGIVDMQAESTEDTPEQEASQLMDNRSLWAVLLNRPQESTRRTAARQLAFLLGDGSIEFDPGAPELVRKAQAEALRKRIGANAAATPNGGAK